MSELKAYTSVDIEEIDNAKLYTSGKLDCTRVYLKSEADKVIANRDYEIEKLKESISNLLKMNTEQVMVEVTEKALIYGEGFVSVEHAMKLVAEIRHQKYKRCLAMRNICRYAQYSYSYLMAYEGCKICTNDIDFRKYDKKYHFYLRWRKRWMELAEKFKEVGK